MSFRTSNTATSIAYNALSLIPVIPPGTLVPYAGTTAPRGWMMCDGRSLSKSQYEKLYRAIGDTYGSSSSEFSIPDMRGRVIVGVNDIHSLAETGGTETHTLSVDEMPVHNHAIQDNGHTHTGTTAINGTHAHTYVQTAGSIPIENDTADTTGLVGSTTGTTAEAGAHAHTFTTQTAVTDISVLNRGNGLAHNNMQPYLSLNYIIRVI